MKTIRIMLVDDHEMVREGIKSLLKKQPDIEVVAEAANGSEALKKIAKTPSDVVIMDISMPELDGLATTTIIAGDYPETSVLALTVHADKQHFFKMLEAGAKGYMTKQNGPDELVAAIRTVAAGNVYLQPALARFLLEDYTKLLEKINREDSDGVEKKKTSPPGLDLLSGREVEVLELIAQGLTAPQIARELNLSPKTIGAHRERIMKKLNLHSTTALVKFAIRAGLIDIFH